MGRGEREMPARAAVGARGAAVAWDGGGPRRAQSVLAGAVELDRTQ